LLAGGSNAIDGLAVEKIKLGPAARYEIADEVVTRFYLVLQPSCVEIGDGFVAWAQYATRVTQCRLLSS
jgi:hypothetical protein